VHRLTAGAVVIILAISGAVIALLISLAVVLAIAPPQPVPPELSALIAKAQLDSSVASWCRGEFRPGGRRGFAVALSRDKGGRYLVIDADGQVTELATFSGGADLSCYSPAEARSLSRSITASSTISGRITPRWNTTVVCAFVEDTSATCWQYSPPGRAFVKIGDWTT
jgi:hypothetical protein